MSIPILETRCVSQTFRKPRSSVWGGRRPLHAVRSVDLKIGEGETFGLVGESGSGKTTLARLLMGIDSPTEGMVLFQGGDIGNLSVRQRRGSLASMQVIFQDPNGSLDPRLKVGTLITEPLRALRVRIDHEARLLQLLDAVGLPSDSISRYPHEFSGGQRQRIAIARALAPRPKVLIADEPVSALDVSVRAKILNLLQDLKEQYDLTLVMVSHDLSVMHHVCDRVAVMYAGKLVEIGPVEQLFSEPSHPYTRTLIDAIPRLHGGTVTADNLADTPAGAIASSTGCAFANRCPLVHDACRVERPELIALGASDERLVACHAAHTTSSPDASSSE